MADTLEYPPTTWIPWPNRLLSPLCEGLRDNRVTFKRDGEKRKTFRVERRASISL